MIKLIQSPKLVKAAGNMPKAINEFFGRANSQTDEISIARMKSPSGWEEPGQTPEFDEYIAICIPAFSSEMVNRDHQNPA